MVKTGIVVGVFSISGLENHIPQELSSDGVKVLGEVDKGYKLILMFSALLSHVYIHSTDTLNFLTIK